MLNLQIRLPSNERRSTTIQRREKRHKPIRTVLRHLALTLLLIRLLRRTRRRSGHVPRKRKPPAKSRHPTTPPSPSPSPSPRVPRKRLLPVPLQEKAPFLFKLLCFCKSRGSFLTRPFNHQALPGNPKKRPPIPLLRHQLSRRSPGRLTKSEFWTELSSVMALRPIGTLSLISSTLPALPVTISAHASNVFSIGPCLALPPVCVCCAPSICFPGVFLLLISRLPLHAQAPPPSSVSSADEGARPFFAILQLLQRSPHAKKKSAIAIYEEDAAGRSSDSSALAPIQAPLGPAHGSHLQAALAVGALPSKPVRTPAQIVALRSAKPSLPAVNRPHPSASPVRSYSVAAFAFQFDVV